MNAMNLHIYVGDTYSFFIGCEPEQSLEKTKQLVESQINYLFQANVNHIEVCGFLDIQFNDIPLHYKIKDFCTENTPLICLLSLTQTIEATETQGPQMIVVQLWPHPQSQLFNAVSSYLTVQERQELISKHPPPFPHANPIQIPQISSTQHKCQPYCTPLAKFGDNQSMCPICGEVKAYLPTNDQYCTDQCKTTEQRKTKSHNLDFCSICMSRYRNSKYPRGCIHQCKQCHRPWLLLNSEGICRTCHCVTVQNANAPFRQVYHKVQPRDGKSEELKE